MAAKMSSVSELQVKAEADRLNGARDSAMSEKRTYVKVFMHIPFSTLTKGKFVLLLLKFYADTFPMNWMVETFANHNW